MSVQGLPSCHKKTGPKPGLYNQAASTNSSCSCDAAFPLPSLPTPRLPSSLVHPSSTTTRSASPSPLLKSSSLKRVKGVSSITITPTTTTFIVNAPASVNSIMATTATTTIEPDAGSRYAGLSSAPSTPKRPPNPRQPSRSERMLRATLDRDRSVSCSSRAPIFHSHSHSRSQDPSCSSSAYDPFTSAAESETSCTGVHHAEPPTPSSARLEFPPFDHMSHPPFHTTGSGAPGSPSMSASRSKPPTAESSPTRSDGRRPISPSGARPAASSTFGLRSSSPAPGLGMTRIGSENFGLGSTSLMTNSAEQRQQQYYYGVSQARPGTPRQHHLQKADASLRTIGRPTTPSRGSYTQTTLQRIHSSPASSPPLSALRAAAGTGDSPSSPAYYLTTATPVVSPTPARHSHARNGSASLGSSHVKRPTTPSSVRSTSRYHQRRDGAEVQHEHLDPHLPPIPSTTSNYPNGSIASEVIRNNNSGRNTSRGGGGSTVFHVHHQHHYYNRGRNSSPSPSSSSSREREHRGEDREWSGHHHHRMPSSLSSPSLAHAQSETQSNYAAQTQVWIREAFIGECDSCTTPHRSSSPALAPAAAAAAATVVTPLMPSPTRITPAVGAQLASFAHAQPSPSPSRSRVASCSHYQYPSSSPAKQRVPAANVTHTVRQQKQRSLSPSPSSADLTTSRSSSRETQSLDDDSDSDSDVGVVPVHFNFAPRPGMHPRSHSSAQRRAVSASVAQHQDQKNSGNGIRSDGSNKFLTPPPSPQHVSQAATPPAPGATPTTPPLQNQTRRARSKSQSHSHPPHTSSSNASSNSSSARHSRHSSEMCAAFDANKAAAQLRLQEGYVSFADVQGLGRVDDVDCDDDEYGCEDEAGGKRGAAATGKWLLGLLGR